MLDTNERFDLRVRTGLPKDIGVISSADLVLNDEWSLIQMVEVLSPEASTVGSIHQFELLSYTLSCQFSPSG